MDYSPKAFTALHEDIDRQGGASLPDPCMPERIEYPNDPMPKDLQNVTTCGCGNTKIMTRFVIPYDGPENATLTSGFVTVCAVCDDIGAWPRYRDAVNEADPRMNIMLWEDPEEDEEEDEDDGS